MAAVALLWLHRAALLPTQSDATWPVDVATPSQYVPDCTVCSLFVVYSFRLVPGAICCVCYFQEHYFDFSHTAAAVPVSLPYYLLRAYSPPTSLAFLLVIYTCLPKDVN